MCIHQPPCPHAQDDAWAAARVVVSYPQQGWSLLCNGVVAFDDTGALRPDGTAVPARRGVVSPTAADAGRYDRELSRIVARIAAAQAAGTPLRLRRTSAPSSPQRRLRFFP